MAIAADKLHILRRLADTRLSDKLWVSAWIISYTLTRGWHVLSSCGDCQRTRCALPIAAQWWFHLCAQNRAEKTKAGRLYLYLTLKCSNELDYWTLKCPDRINFVVKIFNLNNWKAFWAIVSSEFIWVPKGVSAGKSITQNKTYKGFAWLRVEGIHLYDYSIDECAWRWYV